MKSGAALKLSVLTVKEDAKSLRKITKGLGFGPFKIFILSFKAHFSFMRAYMRLNMHCCTFSFQ